MLDLNLLSIARSNLVFLPLLLAQGRGHVVNTASASGLLAYGFDRLPYVASKHAVVGVSEALALYLGTEGHRRHLRVPVRRDHEHPRADHGVRRGDVAARAAAPARRARTPSVSSSPTP